MSKHEKCGWCKKALTKKRRTKSPVGADCEERLPDKLNVAILNITLHDGAHCPQESKWNIAKRSIDDYFGEDAEIVIIVDQNYGAGFAEADVWLSTMTREHLFSSIKYAQTKERKPSKTMRSPCSANEDWNSNEM